MKKNGLGSVFFLNNFYQDYLRVILSQVTTQICSQWGELYSLYRYALLASEKGGVRMSDMSPFKMDQKMKEFAGKMLAGDMTRQDSVEFYHLQFNRRNAMCTLPSLTEFQKLNQHCPPGAETNNPCAKSAGVFNSRELYGEFKKEKARPMLQLQTSLAGLGN